MNKENQTKKTLATICTVALFVTWMAFHFLNPYDRRPASVEHKSLFDFFVNNKNAEHLAFEQNILEGIRIAKKEKNFEIDVRNFLVKNSTDNLHLCEYFDSYTLTFEAEGIASSGERPSMSITSPCEISPKTSMPKAVVIPVEDIFKLKPSDTDISFQINPKANFSFRNVSEIWPEYWVLSKVEFNNKQFSVRDVVIDRRDIYKFSKTPLTMEWQ